MNSFKFVKSRVPSKILSPSPVVVLECSRRVLKLDISDVWVRTVLENSCITGMLTLSVGLAVLPFLAFTGYTTPNSYPKSCLKYGIPVWDKSIWLVPSRIIILDTNYNCCRKIIKIITNIILLLLL